MRRRALLLLMIVLLVTGSATGVHASTDCQRWFAAYRVQLLHSQAAKRLRAAKLRARRYAQMKLAGYTRPKPVARPHRHYPRRPRMSRAELLRRFNLACGVLPEREADQPSIKEETLSDFMSGRTPGGDVSPLPVPDDGQLIASNIPPPLPLTGESPDEPPYGGPPNYPPTFGGFPGIPGHPNGPPVSPVPEPESLVLLLTGLVGGAAVIRRRISGSRG